MLTLLLRPGDVVIEVGANIGSITVPLAQAVGPTGAVLAFEPQRIAHQMLCANIALNGLANVVARQAAVGDSPGRAFVPVLDPTQEYNFGDVALERWTAETGHEVPVETIDAAGISRCRLIKADVQGMEAAVLRGAARTIATLRPALYVENDRRDRSAELIALIRSMGYRLWWHAPPLFNPANHSGAAENIFDTTLSLNLLCFPEEAGVALDAPPVQSDDEWPENLR